MRSNLVRFMIVGFVLMSAASGAVEQSDASIIQESGGFEPAAYEQGGEGTPPFSWSITDTQASTGAGCTFIPDSNQVVLYPGAFLRLTNLTTEEQPIGYRSFVGHRGSGGSSGWISTSNSIEDVIPASGTKDLWPPAITVPIGGNYFLGYQVWSRSIYASYSIYIEYYARFISGDPTYYSVTNDCVTLFPGEVTLSKTNGMPGEQISYQVNLSYQVNRFHCCFPHILYWDGTQIDRFFIDYQGTLSFTIPANAFQGLHQLKWEGAQGHEITKTFTVFVPTSTSRSQASP